MKVEQLFRMTVPVGPGCISPEETPMSPEFRVAVQEVRDDAVRVIIHANGHDSETLDRWVIGDQLLTLEAYEFRQRMLPRTNNA
jgi:16S rRNA U516 pseudouridylate synthase RsuA-like enzyme